MHCSIKKQLVENLTSLWSFIMKKNGQKVIQTMCSFPTNTGDLAKTVAHWTSNAFQPKTKILTKKNIIFYRLLHV